jgi:apolipoprotein N-acyltransferase
VIHPNRSVSSWAFPVASGILYAASFPRIDFSPAAWIALVPLLVVIQKETPKRAFYLGWLAGGIAFTGLLYWTTITMTKYGGLPWPATLPLLFLLVAYMGLYVAGFSALVVWIRSKIKFSNILLIPVIWTTLEWLRAHALTGFPWVLIGYSQYQNLPMIQIADLTGVYGVSFLVAFVNAAIVEGTGIIDRTQRRKASTALFAATLCIIIVWGYGHWRLSRLIQPSNRSVNIGIVQANIPQHVKWDPAFRQETFDRYAQLTHRVSEEGLDLIVWPEAAMPFIFEDDLFFQQEVLKLVRHERTPLLFGSPARTEGAKAKASLSNSAYLVDASGKAVARYDKIHLVPFGEYVPLSSLLFFVDKMVEGIGDFTAGNRYTVMRLPPMNREEIRMGVVICFEVIFPDLVRQFVREGADFMITITNDAWFGRSSAPYQHFSMVVFRSIENRVPFIRAANTGISGFIDVNGQILKSTDLFTEAAIANRVSLSGQPTFYTRAGDIFAYSCGIMSTALILIRIRTSKRIERGNAT